MKHILLLAVMLAVVSPVFASTSTEVEWNGEGTPTFWALLQKPVSKDGKIGVAINVNATENWGQCYGMVTYAPARWCQVGLGTGFETFGSHERAGGFIWVGRGRLSACAVVENGASGPWHRYNLDYQATDRWAVGLVDKAYAGFGPTVTYKVAEGTKIRLNAYDAAGATIMLQQSF